MKSGTLSIIVILIVIAVGGWYYYSALKTPAEGPQLTATTTSAPGGGMETGTVGTTTPAEEDFTVTAYNFGFSPNTLTVQKGDHVKITLVDTGGVHDFVIDEFGVRTPRLDTNASTTVEFDADKAGTFQYYCSVGNQRAAGMWGTLTIVD